MDHIELSENQKKSRRNRNIWLGVVLGLLVIGFYAMTLIKFGQGMAQ